MKKQFWTYLLVGLSLVACKPKELVTTEPSKPKEKDEGFGPRDVQFTRAFIDGVQNKFLGNFEEAVNFFVECIRLDSSEGAPYYELGNILDAIGEDQTALKYSKRAYERDPANYWYAYQYAQSLQKNNKIEESIKIHTELIENNPEKLEHYYEKANLELYIGRGEDAVKTLDQLEKITTLDPEVTIQKHKIYLRLGDADKAADELKKLIDKFPDEPLYYIMIAEVYKANNMTEKAFETYQLILEKFPDDAPVHLALADYYQSKGDSVKSFKELQIAFGKEALEVDTKMRILLNYYSITEQPNDELKNQAYQLLETLKETHPEDPKVYTIKGDFLYRDKRYKEARKEYKNALKYDQSRFAIWSQLILIESELMNFDSMLVESTQAQELFPNQPMFYFFRGVAHIQLKQYKEGIEVLLLGRDIVLDNPALLSQFNSNLGDAYNEMGEYDKSDEAYEEALKIDPNNAHVLNNYSYYLSERTVNQQENLERAEVMSRKSNMLEPNQASYQDTYGWVLYKLGRYEEAKEWLEKAVSNGGDSHAIILEHLGDAYYQIGNKDAAMEYWLKAKRTKGDVSDFLDKKIEKGQLYE